MCYITANEPTTSSSAVPTTPKKSVSICPIVYEYDASEHHHFDEEQMEDMWYNKSDMNAFRKQCKKLIKKSTTSRFPQEDCYRGLEVFVNSNRSVKYESKVLPVLDLFDELLDLVDQGSIVDGDIEEALRFHAVSLTRACTHDAIQRAVQDAVEAYQLYHETPLALVESGVQAVVIEKSFPGLALRHALTSEPTSRSVIARLA